MVGFILPAQINGNYAANSSNYGVYDTQSAIEHLDRAANETYSHPALAKNKKNDVLNRFFSNPKYTRLAKQDSVKTSQRVIGSRTNADSAKSVEQIVEKVQVPQKLSKAELAYFNLPSNATYAEVYNNDSLVVYDSSGKVLSGKLMSRRELSALNRLVRNYEPKEDDIVVVPTKYAKFYNKVDLKDRKKVDIFELVDGNLIRTFDKKGKLIEKRLLTDKEIESLNLNYVKEGDVVNIGTNVEGKTTHYSGFVDSTGKRVTGFNDAGLYEIVCEVGTLSKGIFEKEAAETLYVHVADVNHAPEGKGIGSIVVAEGEMLKGRLGEFSDKDNDKIRVGLKDTSIKWLSVDSAGNYILTPNSKVAAKGSADFVANYFVTDEKDTTNYKLSIHVLDRNQRAQMVLIDSNDVVKVKEGEAKTYAIKLITPDSSAVDAKSLSLSLKEDRIKDSLSQSALADTSFDSFIQKIIRKEENKDSAKQATDSLAEPSSYIRLVKDSLGYSIIVNPPKNAASKELPVREISDIVLNIDDGKEKYEIGNFKVVVYDQQEKVEKTGSIFSVSKKTKEDLDKEAKEARSIEKAKADKEYVKKSRLESLTNGSYDTKSSYDFADNYVADKVVKELAQLYAAGKYETVLGKLSQAKLILAKKGGEQFSSYKNLKRIADEMAKFKGYTKVLANLAGIHDLVNKVYESRRHKHVDPVAYDSSKADSLSADSLIKQDSVVVDSSKMNGKAHVDSSKVKGRTKAARKDNSLKTEDYRKAKTLIKRTRRIVEENGLDKNLKCKELIDRINVEEQVLFGRTPSVAKQIFYQLSSPGRATEWKERPLPTIATLTGEIAAAVGLYFLGKEGVDAYHNYELEKQIQKDRDKPTTPNIGPGNGGVNDSLSHANDAETDSTSSDSLDSNQGLFKRAVISANKEAAIEDGKDVTGIAGKLHPYINLGKKQFGIIFKTDF